MSSCFYRKTSTSNPETIHQSHSDVIHQSYHDTTHQSYSDVTHESYSDATNQSYSDATNQSYYDVTHPHVLIQHVEGGCGVDISSTVPDTIVYSHSKGVITYEDALEMLNNPDLTRVSTKPPVRPKADEIYLISDEGEKSKANDWSCDGYSWSNRNGHSKEMEGIIVWRQTYHIKRSNKTPDATFQRRLYQVKNAESRYRLIHYTGDSSAYSPRSHGNQKNGE